MFSGCRERVHWERTCFGYRICYEAIHALKTLLQKNIYVSLVWAFLFLSWTHCGKNLFNLHLRPLEFSIKLFLTVTNKIFYFTPWAYISVFQCVLNNRITNVLIFFICCLNTLWPTLDNYRGNLKAY